MVRFLNKRFVLFANLFIYLSYPKNWHAIFSFIRHPITDKLSKAIEVRENCRSFLTNKARQTFQAFCLFYSGAAYDGKPRFSCFFMPICTLLPQQNAIDRNLRQTVVPLKTKFHFDVKSDTSSCRLKFGFLWNLTSRFILRLLKSQRSRRFQSLSTLQRLKISITTALNINTPLLLHRHSLFSDVFRQSD